VNYAYKSKKQSQNKKLMARLQMSGMGFNVLLLLKKRDKERELLSYGHLSWGDNTPRSPVARAFVCPDVSYGAASQSKEVFMSGGPMFLRMSLLS
jgi:hypothetical protein